MHVLSNRSSRGPTSGCMFPALIDAHRLGCQVQAHSPHRAGRPPPLPQFPGHSGARAAGLWTHVGDHLLGAGSKDAAAGGADALVDQLVAPADGGQPRARRRTSARRKLQATQRLPKCCVPQWCVPQLQSAAHTRAVPLHAGGRLRASGPARPRPHLLGKLALMNSKRREG